MADTIDGLYIEIESGATNAGSQLDMLTSKLEGLKKTVGSSTPLKTFSRNYQTLIDTINNSTGIDTEKIESLRSFTTVMAGMNNIKISSSIATQLNNLDFVVQHLSGESLDGLYSFINAMSSLVRLKDVSISATFVKNLDALANFATRIEGRSFNSLKELTSALANLGPIANMDASSISGLNTSVKTLSESTRTASTRGRTFNTVLANIRTRTLLLVRATQTIRRMTTQAIGVYGDYIETLNLFKMAMGGAGQEAYEFAEKAQELLGIDLTQWMKAQGVFNALASGFGVASDRAAIMSKNLTQLAYDISSFYNIDVDTAVEKVRSGFSGQIRPVRDLGYDLSQARLEAIALSLGIDKTVKSMTQAEKSQLRYIALMTQLKQVQGDLSRTLDSPINQMRILQAQLQQMYRSIGMTLLPILNQVLPYLNAILRVIKMIADEIAAMFGYTLPKIASGDWSSSVVSGAEDIEDELDSATGAAEKLKNTLAGFDQINLISSKSGGSGSGAGSVDVGGDAFDFELPEYDFLGDALENKSQKIAESMMRNIRPFVEFLKDAIMWTVNHIGLIKEALEIIAVVSIGKKLYGSIMDAKKWFTGLNDTVAGLGLITIGVQMAWLGGKDLAQGKIMEGLIKSALGIGSATWGGFKMAGPLGAVVGFSLGVAFTITGYFDEKTRQTEKEIRDRFYAIRESAKPLDEVAESWNHFLEQFGNQKVMEKFGAADKLNQTVQNVGSAMATLQMQYGAGSISTMQYAESLESMYAKMEESIAGHIKGVGDALIESLHGPLGLWYEANGVNIKELEEMVGMTTDRIIKKLEQNNLKLQELNHNYKEGKISTDDYKKAVTDLLGPLEKYYDRLGISSEATDQFIQSFKDIDINFDKMDETLETLKNVKKGYEDTAKSLDEEKQKVISGWEALIPDATEEEKKQYEKAIKLAETFFETQRGILDNNYRELLESFEMQGAINWRDAMGLNDYDVVQKVMYDDMKDLDDMLDEMFGDAKMDRNETYWKQLIELVDEYEKVAWGEGQFGELYDEYDQKFSKFYDNFVNSLKDKNDATKHLTDSEKSYMKVLEGGLIPTYNKTGNAFKNYVNEGDYYAQLYSRTMSDTASAVKVNMNNATVYMDDATTDMLDLADRKVRLIGDVISDPSWSANEMNYAMTATANVMSSPSVLNAFMHGADVVMGRVSSEITGSKGAVQKAYMGALNMPLKPVVDLGTGLGHAIADGIASSATYIEQATKEGTKGAAKELNRFGEGFAQFMREISSSTMTGFDAFYQAMGVGSITYTPPKIKTPRVKGYATGGFPDTADFFYANENGVPEYVGTMGGRTAVATNTDIVKGVSDGVYRAIASTGIQNDVKKIANKNGKVVFAPSEEAGRVMQQSVDMYNGTGGRY